MRKFISVKMQIFNWDRRIWGKVRADWRFNESHKGNLLEHLKNWNFLQIRIIDNILNFQEKILGLCHERQWISWKRGWVEKTSRSKKSDFDCSFDFGKFFNIIFYQIKTSLKLLSFLDNSVHRFINITVHRCYGLMNKHFDRHGLTRFWDFI